MTTDEVSRPLARWTRCDLGGRSFEFFPVVRVAEAGTRCRVPLSLRFAWGAIRHLRDCSRDFDVYEFHRVEPALVYLQDRRPKNAFLHQDMAVIRSERNADILWRHLPTAYFAIESRVMHSLSSAWCVREKGAESLRKRYPFLANQIYFTPTWVDPEVFSPLLGLERHRVRLQMERVFGLDPGAFRVITVGRLDRQKNPQLLLSAASRLIAEGKNVELLLVGDGQLRGVLERRVNDEGLSRRIRFLGLRDQATIARLLQACDCFALSSAYEGMPMALLEALGSGVPVVTTPVGEVHRAVVCGVSGEIAADHSVGAFVERLDRIRCSQSSYTVERCLEAIERFKPAKVLDPVYENYRCLVGCSRKSGA